MTDHGGAASPRTEAGRQMLADVGYAYVRPQRLAERILAIEAEAAQEAPAPEGLTDGYGSMFDPPFTTPPTPAEPPRPEAHGDWCVQTIRATEHGDTLSSFMHNDRCRAEARPPEGRDLDRLADILHEVLCGPFATIDPQQCLAGRSRDEKLAEAIYARLSAGGATE